MPFVPRHARCSGDPSLLRVTCQVPVIIYIAKSGALLERMVKTGVDVVSLDWTVTIDDARARIGNKVGIQGNLDPAVLYGPKHIIKERTESILKMAGDR